VGAIINEKVGRKLQSVKMVQRYNRVKISPCSEEESFDICGWYHKGEGWKEAAIGQFSGIIGLRYPRGITNEMAGRKLQRVKTVQRYNRIKIPPSSEAEKLDMRMVS
jgi:hypothetical protein